MNANWSEKKIVLLFFIVSAGLRFFSFFPSVLDHDESTYLIIGRDILHGKELYTDVTDTKPAGVFLFYAALEFIFGGSIFLKRLVFALVVGLTAFLIYRISVKFFNDQKAAVASGLVYIFYTSVWIYHGRSPNTELLFNLTTAGALLFFLKPSVRYWISGGLLMGIGFIIKYLVLFDLMAFLLFFFMFSIIDDKKVLRKLNFWGRFLTAGSVFLAVFGLLNLYFWLDDPQHDFFYVTYELPGNYGSNPSLKRYGTMIADFLGKFFPISFFIFYVVFRKHLSLKNRRIKWFFLIWISFILIAIYLPGKEFSHYTIQLMLPLSLLAGLFFHPDFKKDKYTNLIFSGKTGLTLLILLNVAIQTVSFINEVLKPDYPREIAAGIKKELKSGDRIYVSNYEQIVYYLLKQESPTKYIHPNLIFTETHKAFKINVPAELGRIMNTTPDFIIVERENLKFTPLMDNKYRLIDEFDYGKIRLFRKI